MYYAQEIKKLITEETDCEQLGRGIDEVIKRAKENPYFKPSHDGSGWGVQPIGPSPLGVGDMHDTFHVDSLGNITGLHTTFQLPGAIRCILPPPGSIRIDPQHPDFAQLPQR